MHPNQQKNEIIKENERLEMALPDSQLSWTQNHLMIGFRHKLSHHPTPQQMFKRQIK